MRYFRAGWWTGAESNKLGETADGALDVYDAHMNPVKNYRLPAKQFDKAIKQLNRFFK